MCMLMFMLKRLLIKLWLRVKLRGYCTRPTREGWLCGCGNSEAEEGFMPCNVSGYSVPEPEEEEPAYYKCRSCKLVILPHQYRYF